MRTLDSASRVINFAERLLHKKEAEKSPRYVRLARTMVPGESVYHPAFGTGVVLSVMRSDAGLELTVSFEGKIRQFSAIELPAQAA